MIVRNTPIPFETLLVEKRMTFSPTYRYLCTCNPSSKYVPLNSKGSSFLSFDYMYFPFTLAGSNHFQPKASPFSSSLSAHLYANDYRSFRTYSKLAPRFPLVQLCQCKIRKPILTSLSTKVINFRKPPSAHYSTVTLAVWWLSPECKRQHSRLDWFFLGRPSVQQNARSHYRKHKWWQPARGRVKKNEIIDIKIWTFWPSGDSKTAAVCIADFSFIPVAEIRCRHPPKPKQ